MKTLSSCFALTLVHHFWYASAGWVDVKLKPDDATVKEPPGFGDLFQEAFDVLPWVIDIRRKLHQTPELMFAEAVTSDVIAEALTKLGISYTRGWAINTKHAQLAEKGFESGPGGTGIVAELGTGTKPCILLRADIDALPIQEDKDLVPFQSQEKGKMHACGHDAHAAMLLGAAALLKGYDSLGAINGTIRMIWQPAEEGGAGGKRMVEEGVLTKDPPVQAAFGFHQWPFLPLGSIGGRPHTFMAATELFDITIHGKGGHAAMPHLVKDPIVAASHVVTGIQAITARETDPLSAAVVSVTRFRAGDAYNVIPDGASIGGTLRSLTLEGLDRLRKRVGSVVHATAAAHECNASISWSADAYPPTVNVIYILFFSFALLTQRLKPRPRLTLNFVLMLGPYALGLGCRNCGRGK